jgi:hypothetical protein
MGLFLRASLAEHFDCDFQCDIGLSTCPTGNLGVGKVHHSGTTTTREPRFEL